MQTCLHLAVNLKNKEVHITKTTSRDWMVDLCVPVST